MKTIVCVVAMVTALGAGTIWAAEPEEFTGTWLNIDSKTKDIPKIEIGASRDFFAVHAWGACVPKPCDWGTKNVPIPPLLDDTFTAVYEFDFVTVTLTMTLVSANSLQVHEFVDFKPGHGTDYEIEEYFYQEGQIKPDLVITGLAIPKPLVVYQESPWTWVTMTVKNIGPGILKSGALEAELSGCTLNGEPFSTGGFFDIDYSSPLYPGQTATHSFAVGHSSAWPVGVYSLRVKVDPDNLIDEADEKNNLSSKLAFDVATERFLAGTILYNGNPLKDLTQVPVAHHWYYDYVTLEYPDDYFFWYDAQTSHYLFSGLPDSDLFVKVCFHSAGPWDHLGGNYVVNHNIDIRLLSDAEAGSHDMSAIHILHMIEPQDNGQVLEAGERYPHCTDTRFEWLAVPGAVKYLFKVFLYRDATHPSGPGIEGVMVDVEIPDLSYTPSLPPSEEHFFYSLIMKGYSASGEQLAEYMYTFTGSKIGYGWNYNFKVCPSCVRGDINRDCVVNMLDFAILAQEWLTDTR